MKNNYLDILIELTKKEIKIRYKNSYFGYMWSVAHPLFMALVFYFVFKTISRIDVPHYALFLVSGLFVWQWISNGMSLGAMLFVGNAGLIKKVNFPKSLLGVAMVLSESFNFFFSIPVIVAFMLYYGIMPSFMWIIGIPLLFIITGVFIFGIGILMGAINLFFRDMERIIALFLMMMFYMSPILYPEDKIPVGYEFLLYSNPFSPFIISWRDLFLNGILNFEFIFLSILYATISAILGLLVYKKLKYKFVELI
jgi:lipopolysaccharide transport system permease protein